MIQQQYAYISAFLSFTEEFATLFVSRTLETLGLLQNTYWEKRSSL